VIDDVLGVVADVLVVLGAIVITIGVYGLFRMPDLYTQMHSASKAVFLGVIAFLVATVATLDAAIIMRAALIAVLLIITTPVAAYAVARAAYARGETLMAPDAVDESHRLPHRTPVPGEPTPPLPHGGDGGRRQRRP
jgi:multicomponent Na+:H+ antiporter subunit G